MIDLMETLQQLTDKIVPDFEIYYYKEYPKLIYINLYSENIDKGLKVEKLLNERLNDKIIKSEVYTPTPDEIKYAFSGYDFTGVIITVNEKNVSELTKDHYLVNHNFENI